MSENVKINKILEISKIHGDFNRCDVAVIYLSIDNFLKIREQPFEIYKKMQILKGGFFIKKHGEELGRKLLETNIEHGIKNIQKYIRIYRDNTTETMIRFGPKLSIDESKDITNQRNRPIQIGLNNILNNGSHRLATALYFKHDTILADILDIGKFKPGYDIQWFKDRDFTEEELKQIQNTIETIRSNYGKH